MITEDYVSFEVAKLLKEKGFDENTEHKMWYVIKQFSTGCQWNSCTHKVGDITREYNNDCCISMPTHQMVMKWLREVHNIFIEINTSIDLNGKYHFSYTILDKECKYVVKVCRDPNWNYEDATEVALKYVLENLI